MRLNYKSRVGVVALAIALLITIIFIMRSPSETERQADTGPSLATEQVEDNAPGAGVVTGPGSYTTVRPIDGPIDQAADMELCDLTNTTDDGDAPAYPWEENPPDILAIADFLSRSQDPQHKMVAAVLTVGEENFPMRGARFKAALEADPNDPASLSIAYFQCHLGQSKDWCDAGLVETNLIAVDSNNADTWANIAGRRANKDDLDGALDAIQRAATAPALNTFYMDHYEMMDRGLAAAGVSDHVIRFYLATAYGFSSRVQYRGIYGACREQSIVDARWFEACLSFGERLEKEADTEMDRVLGLSIQGVTLSDRENDARKPIVTAKQARRDERIKKLMGNKDAMIAFEKEFWANDMLVAAYAKELIDGDEFTAQALREEYRISWMNSLCSAENSDQHTEEIEK